MQEDKDRRYCKPCARPAFVASPEPVGGLLNVDGSVFPRDELLIFDTSSDLAYVIKFYVKSAKTMVYILLSDLLRDKLHKVLR